MMFSFTELESAGSNHLWLKILPADQEKAWHQAQRHSQGIARYNAYLNHVCLSTFLNWLSDWLKEESLPQPSMWLSEESLASILEIVNGTAIELGQTRLVLIPSETLEIQELSVPQEWIDIPSWVADYYLAIQVYLDGDEDECFLRVSGFTTHRQLKNSGKYNDRDRTYSIATEKLTENLSVLQMTLGLHVQEELVDLPALSQTEATKLLQQLGDPSMYSPRLGMDVPFAKWGALLADERWRIQLYNRRMRNEDSQVAAIAPDESSQVVVNLRQWLQNVVEEGWQQFEAFFAQLEPTPAYGRRGSGHSSGDAIAPLIRLLQPHQPEQTRYQAAGVLGEIGAGSSDAIKALIELLHTAKDEETRWQAAVSLGKIDPQNPQAGVKKARLIDLGMQLEGHAVALVVAIIPKADRRIGVFLQVLPHGVSKLPPHLKLSVLSESGETRLEAVARSDDEGRGKDKSIELRFSPPPGKRFRVKVTLNDVSVIEEFVT